MNENERYQRQVSLKEFGEKGQEKLRNAKVFIAGAGGLGCPALLYLAASGVGCIGIADDDFVSLNNLHRQVLFSTEDIGKPKVLVAKKKINQLNPEVNIVAYQERLINLNALNILEEYDAIIDGTDNFAVKYMLNDACVLLDKPLIYGAVSKYEGQVGILNVADEKKIKCNYRDLFPQPPTEPILNCSEEGVLGTLTGIIGAMQANETIKLLTGIGVPLINQLLIYNSLNNQSNTIEITENKKAYHSPKDEEEFIKMDYAWLCLSDENIKMIDAAEFQKMLIEKDALFIDVRENNEKPVVNFNHEKIPLSQFENEIKNINQNTIVLFCQTGKRSLQAAQMLLKDGAKDIKVYSLNDGILSLQD